MHLQSEVCLTESPFDIAAKLDTISLRRDGQVLLTVPRQILEFHQVEYEYWNFKCGKCRRQLKNVSKCLLILLVAKAAKMEQSTQLGGRSVGHCHTPLDCVPRWVRMCSQKPVEQTFVEERCSGTGRYVVDP